MSRMKIMTFYKLPTIAILLTLLPFLNSATASDEKNTSTLISNCLKLNDTLFNAFKESLTKLKSAKATVTDDSKATNNASFHYQNFDKGFKGICSNAQFTIEKNKPIGTKDNQRFVFLWSTEFNAQANELSAENVEYTIVPPKNIKHWFQQPL